MPTILTSFPADQTLIYNGFVFYANESGYMQAPFTNLTALKSSDFVPISSDVIPSFNIADSVNSSGYFVFVGLAPTMINTVPSPATLSTVSLWSPDYHFFITDSIPAASGAKMIAIVANTDGLFAIANDGTTFFASLPVSSVP